MGLRSTDGVCKQSGVITSTGTHLHVDRSRYTSLAPSSSSPFSLRRFHEPSRSIGASTLLTSLNRLESSPTTKSECEYDTTCHRYRSRSTLRWLYKWSKERLLERIDIDEHARLDAEQQQQHRGIEGDREAGNRDGSGGAGISPPTKACGQRIVRHMQRTFLYSSSPAQITPIERILAIAFSTSPSPFSTLPSTTTAAQTSSPTTQPKRKSEKTLIIGATLAALALFILSFFSCFCICCPGPAVGLSFGVGGKGTPRSRGLVGVVFGGSRCG
ncbi:hypothetical protein BD410DRAFT_100539 [Rickenella mellea]|uniref:Uncharacterized protein n=1 Tax=Rickenella mellea TaxID=50990 RepID=A0A4Y7PKS2_9AGAM|nr:hypothetical protein BD410DRAFT_100539 [Rickenella mellea]